MDKPQIKIIDSQFGHSNGGSFGTGDLNIKPTHFDWYRGSDNINDLVVITEDSIHKVDECTERYKVLLILEPPCINSDIYAKIRTQDWQDKFDLILTHQRDLLPIIPKAQYYCFGGCWIKPEDCKIYPKTKNISIIASAKKDSEGHKLRHEVIGKYGHLIDVYGRGYKPIDNKLEALKDYRYSIVIENERSNGWLTEKANDCFATGTIPIYWGDPTISDKFEMRGISTFNDLGLLDFILYNLFADFHGEMYKESLLAIKLNLLESSKYRIPEDLLWEQYFKDLIK